MPRYDKPYGTPRQYAKSIMGMPMSDADEALSGFDPAFQAKVRAYDPNDGIDDSSMVEFLDDGQGQDQYEADQSLLDLVAQGVSGEEGVPGWGSNGDLGIDDSSMVDFASSSTTEPDGGNDEIIALRSANERLRKALRELALSSGYVDKSQPTIPGEESSTGARALAGFESRVMPRR